MTTKADFTDEEWTRLERAPLVAGMAISFADPGGPIEAAKESLAAVKTILETAKTGNGDGELVDARRQGRGGEGTAAGRTRSRASSRAARWPGEEILDELRAVNEIVTEKATPEEAEAFRKWLLEAAQRTADAAKEGGFLGFNAERVSEGEQKMLDKLGEVLRAPSSQDTPGSSSTWTSARRPAVPVASTSRCTAREGRTMKNGQVSDSTAPLASSSTSRPAESMNSTCARSRRVVSPSARASSS